MFVRGDSAGRNPTTGAVPYFWGRCRCRHEHCFVTILHIFVILYIYNKPKQVLHMPNCPTPKFFKKFPRNLV